MEKEKPTGGTDNRIVMTPNRFDDDPIQVSSTSTVKKRKNNHATSGLPKMTVDQGDLKDSTLENQQMTSKPSDIKKKDAPSLSVGGKMMKDNFARESNCSIEKRVKRIIREARGVTDNGDLIDKEVLKKFLLEIEESEGFYFSKFPGYIDVEDVPEIYPYQEVLDNRYNCPEKYAKILFLAAIAIATHNKNHGTHFKVVEIEHLNVSMMCSRNVNYYITFSGIEVRGTKKGLFLRLFVNVFYFIIILSLFCCGFWRKVPKLTRKWFLSVFKATDEDLQDENAVRGTFRALAIDNVIDRKQEVVSCRLLV